MFLILPDILSADELADLAAGFDTAAFEDGRNTAAGAAQMVKKNRQISRQWPGIRHFENILDNALKRSTMLIQQLSPAACSPTIFAEYHPGDGYGCHTDTVMGGQPPIRHDISVTLFLNAPDSYTGGELRLHLPGGQIQDVKCEAGAALAYPTTLVHEVLPVRSGIRRVAVFWLQSFYRDSEVRQIVADLREGLSQLRNLPDTNSLPIARALANLERKFIGQ